MFRNKAESYCQDIPGVQTFQLLAFYGGRTEPQAWQPFLISGQLDNKGLGTEPPTAEGRTMQKMRHEEVLIQSTFKERAMLLDRYDTLLNMQRDMLKQTSDALLESRQESLDAVKVVKEVMLEKVSGDQSAALELEKFKRSTRERAKWLNLAPALVNQLLGREIFPQSTVDTALVDSITDNINQEQIEKLMGSGILTPEQVGFLANRMMKRLKASNEEHSTELARGSEVEEDAPKENEVSQND
jgi:hypothetical protein